jgi:hypothetical protein
MVETVELEAPPVPAEAAPAAPLAEAPTEAPPPPAAAPPPTVTLPRLVVAHLVSLGLRTDQGRACWECFVAGKVDEHPWLAAPPSELVFLPEPGTLRPRPEAAG